MECDGDALDSLSYSCCREDLHLTCRRGITSLTPGPSPACGRGEKIKCASASPRI